MEEIRMSVRTLVEFLLRSGSIDARYGGTDRMQEGSRIHRRLQKEAGKRYKSEVPLSLSCEKEEFIFTVEGRADGIVGQDGEFLIDEIKTTGTPSEYITEEFDQAHWGQVMCYGHFLCVRDSLPGVRVRLTYFQVDTEEIIRFERRYCAEELSAFYDGLLTQYLVWARLRMDWAKIRDASIHALAFPFGTYRPYQRELAVAAYRAIERKERLFCQAPTGIGKTISTLFPGVKAMGAGMVEKLFYLTAKTTTRQTAQEAFARMEDKGLRFKSITLTAKDKVCFLEERSCNPEDCPYADGYYDRIREAVYHLVTAADRITREELVTCAQEFKVCPYELSLDVSQWCDAVICDYNYLFDPVVYLKRYFSDSGRNYVFLIDEAHNLLDRARSMYSAVLCKSQVMALRRAAKEQDRFLYRLLEPLNQYFIQLRKELEVAGVKQEEELPKALWDLLLQLQNRLSLWMEEHKSSLLYDDVLAFTFESGFFLQILELYDKHYITYFTADRQDVAVKLFCRDPAPFLDEMMGKGRSTVLFSATLSPPDYFISVLGGGETAKNYSFPSPYDPKNLCVLIEGRVSTKYADRERSLEPVSELLYAMTEGKPGNYMAYFPSYQYRNQVYDVFCAAHPEVAVLRQEGGMDDEVRAAFLAQFDAANQETLLGFCVLGGVYAEGVDLPGDRLIGTAIVGVGLPQVNPEQELLRQYYQEVYGSGFAYGYQYPGMNKVLQAAGRVIRGERDRGVVLLIDSRFASSFYGKLFPGHWRPRRIQGPQEAKRALEEFWKK